MRGIRLQSERPVTVKGKIIGGPAPLICLPLVAKERNELLHQAQKLISLNPDLLEWRVDGYDDAQNTDNCLQTLSHLHDKMAAIPLIFTCRIDQEGGMQEIPREARMNLITAAIKTGLLDIIDIELSNDTDFISTILEAAKKNEVKVILSFHDFKKTPGEGVILERLVRAQELGADIAKAAVMPKDHKDVLSLMNTTLKARTQMLKIPSITISMGALGVVSRIAGTIFGSDITFAMGDSASAPGQVPIEELRQALSVL